MTEHHIPLQELARAAASQARRSGFSHTAKALEAIDWTHAAKTSQRRVASVEAETFDGLVESKR